MQLVTARPVRVLSWVVAIVTYALMLRAACLPLGTPDRVVLVAALWVLGAIALRRQPPVAFAALWATGALVVAWDGAVAALPALLLPATLWAGARAAERWPPPEPIAGRGTALDGLPWTGTFAVLVLWGTLTVGLGFSDKGVADMAAMVALFSSGSRWWGGWGDPRATEPPHVDPRGQLLDVLLTPIIAVSVCAVAAGLVAVLTGVDLVDLAPHALIPTLSMHLVGLAYVTDRQHGFWAALLHTVCALLASTALITGSGAAPTMTAMSAPFLVLAAWWLVLWRRADAAPARAHG